MPNAENHAATVLVADDIPANRELLADLLKEEGYRVLIADDGEKAMKMVLTRPIDIALLDVMMPHYTGFEVCQAVKSAPQTRLLPVVLVTGLSDAADRIKGIEAGADDFLNKPVNREELLARVRSLLKLKQYTDELENAEAVLFSLALSIEAKDPYTEGHCNRLSQYSVMMAEHLGLSEEQRIALRRGGIVHDIGKVAIPESILLKPGPLTPEERKIMEQHTIIGERICAPLKSFRNVLPIIRHHHEKGNGTGYPDGLTADQIPLTARILQTVDIYDALTTDRPYRTALSDQRAFALMREEVKKGWWDGGLLDQLEALLRTNKEKATKVAQLRTATLDA